MNILLSVGKRERDYEEEWVEDNPSRAKQTARQQLRQNHYSAKGNHGAGHEYKQFHQGAKGQRRRQFILRNALPNIVPEEP